MSTVATLITQREEGVWESFAFNDGAASSVEIRFELFVCFINSAVKNSNLDWRFIVLPKTSNLVVDALKANCVEPTI